MSPWTRPLRSTTHLVPYQQGPGRCHHFFMHRMSARCPLPAFRSYFQGPRHQCHKSGIST